MNDDQTSTRTAPSRDEAFVQHLLRLRENPRPRAELRRGDTAALEYRAIPYLAAWRLPPPELSAALLFGAAICRYPGIADDASNTFGRAAFRTLSATDQRDAANTNVGRRVVAAQRQTLPLAHRTFNGLLVSINTSNNITGRPKINWTGLWRTYKNWDSTDVDKQRRTRRQLLLEFYGTTPDWGNPTDAGDTMPFTFEHSTN